ncbi:uncharacterized protein Eint_041030 [Encephalitozoon intestinalis ATCC 50506]|uniref:Uncharacterized protein n=1 Tax=Encephalitozoon intestinalis (strain ATCC 50506) TaxID=876142 RepID=E0S6Q7_ENCIT|nr:uncharacterized protein Eint_041030 [Encephalitozoon intestinalis ATCC 50506]ADM11392.1 hypothetical protein Eint_041030 [Encephalitozoon intestinalis ATCC 50506]UTX45083.1 hypothetical protein GPK93_04g06210 [Encephalitozoon intestinalis]
MKSVDFEMKLVERYGTGVIPKEDIESVLNEAIENNVIEKDEVGRWEKDEEYTVSRFLRTIRKWRTDFLKDSFSINDISCKDEGRCGDRYLDEGEFKGLECHEEPNVNDSFVTTDEAFLSSLRDKTKIITSRRNNNGKKIVREVLRAWGEYEKLPTKKKSYGWYFLVLLVVPVYFLYVQKPF